MRNVLLLCSVSFFIACAGSQQEANSPNPQLQSELDAAKAEIERLKTELAARDSQPAVDKTAMNTEAITSVYETKLKPEHFAEYLRSGQEHAAKARGIDGVLMYLLLKHPTKPNTVIWIERFTNAKGKENYAEKSGVYEAQKRVAHMVAASPYVLTDAKETAE